MKPTVRVAGRRGTSAEAVEHSPDLYSDVPVGGVCDMR